MTKKLIKKIESKKIFIFDLDKTLTKSKAPLNRETADLLRHILKNNYVAVISGGMWSQFENQLLKYLPKDTNLNNLLISTTSGSQLYKYESKDNKWFVVYTKTLPKEIRTQIIEEIKKTIKISGIDMPKKIYGQRYEDRLSQITMSAAGQKAPLKIKMAWDPDSSKKLTLIKILRPKLPDLCITAGGSTSIDVTQKNIDKAFGVKQILKILNLKVRDGIYIGDTIFPGGNDYVVVKTGIDTVSVKDYIETREILKVIKNIKK